MLNQSRLRQPLGKARFRGLLGFIPANILYGRTEKWITHNLTYKTLTKLHAEQSYSRLHGAFRARRKKRAWRRVAMVTMQADEEEGK